MDSSTLTPSEIAAIRAGLPLDPEPALPPIDPRSREGLEARIAAGPGLPEELAEAWQKLLVDLEPAHVRMGLRAYLSGAVTITEAAKLGQVGVPRLRAWVRRLSVYAPAWSSQRVINTQRRVAILALEELERRLTEHDGTGGQLDRKEFHAMTLNAIAGTSTDKIARYEGWGQERAPAGPTYASALEKLATALAEGKVSLKIEVATPAAEIVVLPPA